MNNLLPHLSDFTAEKPLHLSVLLTGNFQDDTYINKFHVELSTIKTFEDQYGDVCKIKSLEAKINAQHHSKELDRRYALNRFNKYDTEGWEQSIIVGLTV